MIISGYDGRIVVYNIEVTNNFHYSLSHYMTFKGHQQFNESKKEHILYQINDIKYSSAFGDTIISCGSDFKLKFWDIYKKVLSYEFSSEGN